jgi:membrane fusion protein, multidrug efflux system
MERQFASQAELDQQRLALTQAESQLRSALAQQQIKLNQRGYTTLVADRDGVVTALGAEAGQVVSPGQAVATVAADGEREVLVSIPESRVDELRHAHALQVSVWALQGRTYTGRLRELAPDTDSVTRTYSARIAVPDADAALMLGMTASVFAPDVDGTSAIRVPLTALLHQGGKPQVWIVDGASSKVTARPVTLGSAQGDSVVVTQGLSSGETVVTAGVHMLHAGQKVKTAGAAAAATATPSSLHAQAGRP